MKITVQRRTLTIESTQGEMSLDGIFECYTLEPRDRRFAPASITDGGPTKPYAIPVGTFFWKKYFSPKHGFEVVLIEGVPGFTSIELHPGNIPKDTLGCTVVGTTEQANFVGHSKEEFARLMAKLPDSGTIDYLDAPEPPRQQIQDNPHGDVT